MSPNVEVWKGRSAIEETDDKPQLIVLRGETDKERKTQVVPISATRLGTCSTGSDLDADNEKKSAEALIFSEEMGG